MRRALIAAVCLGLTVSACAEGPSSGSGGQDHAAAIREAIERTLEAGSARITFTLDVRDGARSESVDGTVELVFGDGDPADGEAHLTLHVPELGGGSPAGTFEAIVDRGPVLYVQADALGGFLPVSTPWVKLDPAAMGDGWASVPGMGSPTPAPSDALELLEGVVDVQVVGQETIDGAAATHYRATVDLEALLDRVPEDRRSEVERALEKVRADAGLDPSAIPVDVWLADGLVKQVGFELSPDGSGSADGLSATLTLSDVGATFSIDPPPADQVTDLSQLAAMWSDQAVATSTA
jgi:hypothetical protein